MKGKIYQINAGNSFVVENTEAKIPKSLRGMKSPFGVLFSGEPGLSFIRLLRDGDDSRQNPVLEKKLVLEGYFNDLYKLFLRKLSAFDCQSFVGENEKKMLRLLLEELIKVKGMLGTQ